MKLSAHRRISSQITVLRATTPHRRSFRFKFNDTTVQYLPTPIQTATVALQIPAGVFGTFVKTIAVILFLEST